MKLALLFALLLLTGCTVVNIETSANVGTNRATSKVNGSAWAEVQAAAEATTETAKATAGRDHSVIDSIGLAGIGAAAGALAGGGL